MLEYAVLLGLLATVTARGALGVNPEPLLWLLIGGGLIYFLSSVKEKVNWILNGLLVTLTIAAAVVNEAKLGIIIILAGMVVVLILKKNLSIKEKNASFSLLALGSMSFAGILGIKQEGCLWILVLITALFFIEKNYEFKNWAMAVLMAILAVLILISFWIDTVDPRLNMITTGIIGFLIVIMIIDYIYNNLIADGLQWYYYAKINWTSVKWFSLAVLGSGLYLGPIIAYSQGIIQGSWVLGLILGIWPIITILAIILLFLVFLSLLSWAASEEIYNPIDFY